MGFISVNTDSINVVNGRDPAVVSLVAKYPQPFDGGEGCFPGRELHLETWQFGPESAVASSETSIGIER